jgi:uncharacterized protein (DUF1800 family)
MNFFRSNYRLHPGHLLAVFAGAALSFSGLAHAQKMDLPPSDGVEITPNLDLKNDQLAARFLDQATAGATPEEIASLSAALAAHPDTAFSDWINDQFSKPVKPDDLSFAIFNAADEAAKAQAANPSAGAPTMAGQNMAGATKRADYSLAQGLRGSLMISDKTNELRRMVAYALSQIFVLGDEGDSPLDFDSGGMCDYYDMLYKDAFTDFPTILSDVTYHPAMGMYLSSAGNAKAGFYTKNSRPDENYAREVMQLFTIGLVQLNEDGSIVTDAEGHAIPTYTQTDITEVARIFTGLNYPQGMSWIHGKNPDGTPGMVQAMRPVRYGRDVIDENRHDRGEKTFLGTTFPAAQDTATDIGNFLQFLCNHQNTAPFFAKGMIQHLVTSNPSPAYIKRVAHAFKSSNGDMKTVISAILLDPEARNPEYAKIPEYGKLREPWLRLTELARGFNAQPATEQPFYGDVERMSYLSFGEYPLSSPSVFNFFLPNYQPPGTISDRNANATDGATLLAAPEFQIMNSNTALLTPNYLMGLINSEPANFRPDPNGKTRPRTGLFPLDLTPQISLAKDPAALVDNISTILTGGMMSDRTRGIIKDAVDHIGPDSDPAVLKERVRTAIYLTMASPDYAVQK